ncbi:MAG TPA: hypothetical protein V6C58_15735, partial [Allocoleopsis sp.]
NFIIKNSAICLGLLWVSLVTAGTISFFGLFNPGPKLNQHIEPKPISKVKVVKETPEGFNGVQKTAKSKQNDNLPFWLYGAIAITCASGSMLILRHLNLSTQKPKVKKAKKSHKVAKSSALVVNNQSHQNQIELAQSTTTLANYEVNDMEDQYATSVTILPPEYPDYGEEKSLAQQLDLRQNYPLNAFLDNHSAQAENQQNQEKFPIKQRVSYTIQSNKN